MPDTAKKKKWQDPIAILICVAVFFFWLNFLIKKFTCFGYYDWDLAIYANATWALSQGSLHSSLFGTNFLTNHAEYIAFFVAPIYKLFPSAFTLVILKILAFVSGSFIFYLIAKKLLGWPLGIFLMLLYQFHPANAFMMIYEFHFENLAIIFILLMYYFLQNRQFIPFLISAGFATLVKENISLVVFMFGLYILLKREPKEKGWVIGPILLGLGFFILTMFVITPLLRMHEGIATANQYIGMYWDPSAATTNLTQTIWHNVCARWNTFVSPLNQNYMAALFLPFYILPFLSPLTLFLGGPIFLQHFLSPSPTNHTLYYHYAATAIIFIFLATAESLKSLQKKLDPLFYSLMILLAVGIYSLQIKKFFPSFQWRVSLWQDDLDPARQKMLEKVPPQASIVASFDFLANLVNRKEIFSFHNVWQNHSTFTGKTPFILPANLSYALIDWKSLWLWQDLLSSEDPRAPEYLTQLNKFYFSRSWYTVNAVEDVTLLSTIKPRTHYPMLVENSQSPFPTETNAFNLQVNVNGQFQLVNLKINPHDSNNHTLPFVFIWQSKMSNLDLFAAGITVLQNNNVITEKLHPISYAFNATPLWQEGQYVKESYNLLLPTPLNPGEYTVDIAIINLKTQKQQTLLVNGKKIKSIQLPVLIQ